ncbi:MAG: rRNA pseudouridine synthase [Acidobacteria bacterium]|nr:rRNA pseudouridine synthase [Acidobacteriota bacterium]
MERIHKLIAHAGLCSRRRAEQLIFQGRVTVDGQPAMIGQQVDPQSVAIVVDGVPLPVRPDLVYYLLYKPVDVISTVSDPQGRTVVVDLVPTTTPVHPVGRLDSDSEGLILLTNDGDLTHRLTHPSFGVEKTYQAVVDGAVTSANMARLVRDGVTLDDGPARPVRAVVKGTTKGTSLVEIVLTEGRNREVRRIFDAIGHPVVRLVRTAIGPIRDPSLKPGTQRSLSADEVRSLYTASAGGTAVQA